MAAIYLHIPFCKRLCGYCDFFKSVKLQLLDRTLEAMERELVERRDYLGGERVETIYFGGGTPSLLSVQQIERLLGVIAQNFDVSQVREITLEANPDDLNEEYLSALRSAGVNRLSIGIQSFDDNLLRFMNRRHSSSQAIEAVGMAQSVGFDNITIDLIFGVDGFGQEVLRRSIATALSLGVQHISAYHLTIEDGTPFARRLSRGELQVVSDRVSQAEYSIVEHELAAAGFDHYEVSNYALPSYRSAHNSSYWHGVHYLGVGAAAHSFNGVERTMAVESIEEYIAGGEGRYQSEKLTLTDCYNEYVMTSLRCREGVDLSLLESRFGADFADFFRKNANRWLADCKMQILDQMIFIPTHHFLISDLIIESFFYCNDN